MNNKGGVFLTGATGYLGSRLLHRLLDEGRTVYCLRRSTSNLWRVEDVASKVTWLELGAFDFDDFFSSHEIEFVLHCATDYGRKHVDPIQTIEANLILPLKLLHAAASHGVYAFINTDTILDKGVNNYSLSKKQFLDWLEIYSDRIVGINVALEHFYGPGDDPSKFVTYIIRSLLSGEERIELTKGEQKRDFIFIDDVVDAFMTLVKKMYSLDASFNEFEVGSNELVEIREFVKLVKALTGNSKTLLDFGRIPYRKNEIMSSHVDISKLKQLGWHPKTSLNKGLQETITLEREKV